MSADNPGDLPTLLPSPTLQIRRPQARVVTQTIDRAMTTYTTHVTLGTGTDATPIPEPAAGNSNSGTTPFPPAAPPAGTTNNSPGYNYIGAIVGSVVAFVFLILLLWFCLFRPRILLRHRQRLAARDRYSEDGYDSTGSSSSGSPVPQSPRRPRPHGPPMPVLNPPPVRIRPMRHTAWTHSAEPQIRGVRIFP